MPGDLLVEGSSWYTVEAVAVGPGLGQYRLAVTETEAPDQLDARRVYRWTSRASTRP